MKNVEFLYHNDPLWQMSPGERAAISYLIGIGLIDYHDAWAIEIGSYKGGFLQVLDGWFKRVFSLDVDHSNIIDKDAFDNVTWVEGNSLETLPKLIAKMNHPKAAPLGFVLIDGDHEYETVLQDINNVLAYEPKRDMFILVHDSWYGPTRQAINHANWASNPHITLVDKDFVPGDLVGSGQGNYFVGGLALAIMSMEKRTGELEIKQSQDYMYRVCNALLGGK